MRRRFVLALLIAPALPLACRGSVDRVYDDEVDGSVDDGAVVIDATAADGPTSSDGAGQTDGPLEADLDAEPDGDLPDGDLPDGIAPDAADGGTDASGDAATDADAKSDASVNDAAVDADAGCGPTNTAQNCGACGVTCDPGSATSTIAACATNTCVYTCKPNRQDCNSTAPNTNGCECVGSGCCDGGCQNAHSNGLGSTYYDCVALGTYNQAQALKACNAYVAAVAADGGNAGTCGAFSCAGNSGLVVCSNSGTGACHCWKYDPQNSTYNGKVSISCACPASTSPSWN